MIVFLEKRTGRVALYSSIPSFFFHEGAHLKERARPVLDMVDLEIEDYEDESIRVCERTPRGVHHSQVI